MITCIAIDDEPIALSVIQQYCERLGGIRLETFCSPQAGMMRIREIHPDIVFLDVEMNDTSGIELARELPASCCLIFTTAYAHYALEGFEVNAVDFLHKPFFYDRFCRAIEKARRWMQMNDLLATSQSPARQLQLKVQYKHITISLDNVLYFESMDNYVRIRQTDNTTVLSKVSLHTIEEQLPPGEFIRIHRSFIVPKCRIAKYSRTEVILAKTGKSLPIGKKYADEVAVALSSSTH